MSARKDPRLSRNGGEKIERRLNGTEMDPTNRVTNRVPEHALPDGRSFTAALFSDTYPGFPRFVYFPRLTEWKAIKPDQCPAKRLFPLARGQLSETLLFHEVNSRLNEMNLGTKAGMELAFRRTEPCHETTPKEHDKHSSLVDFRLACLEIASSRDCLIILERIEF